MQEMHDSHGFFYNREDPMDKILYSKKLYEDQVSKAERERYIRDLLQGDYIRSIRGYVTRYDYIDIFPQAQKQVGEKLKKNRPQLETIKHFIVDDFLNKDKTFKLTNITSCGWENYGWEVEFTGYGVTFAITIPVKAKLTPKNLDHMHHGMFSFAVKDGDYCWLVEKASYNIEEMAEFIKNYFESRKSK